MGNTSLLHHKVSMKAAKPNVDLEIGFENQLIHFTLIKGKKIVRKYLSDMRNMCHKSACMITNFTDSEKILYY